MQPVRQVACPRCGAMSAFTPKNKWRPFCSERCKMIDLGAWATESYRVPAEEEDAPDDESPTPTPPGS
ncbi:MAG TPA: DNA gyrase inhibitor YacG [Burkholderiales bacterium]